MPFPFDKYPWLNFQSLNLAYFIRHFREIFQQWDTLLNEMYDWKDATDADLAEWKSTVETGISSWETGLQQSMEDWKNQTEADISTWKSATLAALDAWKTATTAVFEQIRTEAAASATAAAGSASSAQTALAGAQTAQAAAEAAAAGIQSELAQIQQNTNNIEALTNATTQTLTALTAPFDSKSVSNYYYAAINELVNGKFYEIAVTADTDGAYTVQIGTGGSISAMIDTLADNAQFTAGITKRFIYTASQTGLDTIRLSKNTVDWTVDVREFYAFDTIPVHDAELRNLLWDQPNIHGVLLSMWEIGDTVTSSHFANTGLRPSGAQMPLAGYTLEKYPVTAGDVIYVKVHPIADHSAMAFHRTTGITVGSLVSNRPEGYDGLVIVPEGATILAIAHADSDTDYTVNIGNFSTGGSTVIPDGSVTYEKLDNYLKSRIDAIGSASTVTGVGLFHAEADTPTLGDELLDNTGWDLGAGAWTGDLTNGFTHITGNQIVLSRSIPGLIAGETYYLAFTSSTVTQAGYSDIKPSLGGSATFETYSGDTVPHRYEFGIIAGSDNLLLTLEPKINYTGTITGLTLRHVEAFEMRPAVIITDTQNANTANLITGRAERESIYIGADSGRRSAFCARNTALGTQTMKENTDGFWNTAVGTYAMQKNSHGSRNVAIGFRALQECTTGDRNTGIGSFALNGVGSGRGNVAVGTDALQTSQGSFNVAIGVNASGSGSENVAIGHRANASGFEKNVAVGTKAMENSGAGARANVAVGFHAAQQSTGAFNTAIGCSAGTNSTSGDENILIGYNVQKPSPTDSNTIVIGKANHANNVIIAGKKIVFNNDGTISWITA